MQQPEHLQASAANQSASRRFFTLGFVALFHVFIIYAFASGLASQMVQKLPEELKAEVVPPKLPEVKPPPPPPPNLEKPPPPFVPPPEINIQSETPPTNTITVQSQVASIPKKEQAPVTTPVSIGRAHECNSQFYPPIAQRLGQEGMTKVAFHILTDGSVSDPRITESSGHDSLDQAALRCVMTWHYTPATQNGRPIETPWAAIVKWQLQGG